MFEKAVGKARDMFFLNTDIHINGNRSLTIENCTRIEEYNEVFVRLISGGLCVQICGCNLRVSDYCSGGMLVQGKISQVDLIERSGAGNEGPAERMRENKC